MNDRMKNALIGIFVLSSFAVIVFIFLFLHPSLGNKGQRIRVLFTDIDKINVGTRVTFAGKPVGEVEKIIDLDTVHTGRIAHNGVVYAYELILLIDSGVKIYNTDVISARTSGLLGERTISIDPQPSKPGERLEVVNNQILYAESVGTVEETFKEIKAAVSKFDVAVDSITNTLHEIREKKIWDNVASFVENLAEVSYKFNETWPEVNESIANINTTTTNFRDMSDNFRNLSKNFRDISDDIREGKGTIGALLSKNDLYLRTTALLNKGEILMDDVNHYGLLFHLDKGWQRVRARRMNLLNKLSTPQEFRNYFNDEINMVSTSLARVSKVMDKTCECSICPCIIEDCEFQKVFAELIRRVKTLEESIKMYNIQLMDCDVKKTELVENK